MSGQVARVQRGTRGLEAVKGPSDGTTTTYRAYVQGFTRSAHPQTVQGFAEYIEGMKGKRPAASVNLAIAAGKAAFVQAAQRAGMEARELTLLKGALSELRNMRRQAADVATITPAERVKLFSALPLRVRLIAECLYQTGARVSEIVGLRRDHVKVNGHVELRLFGKGSKEREATITAGLYARILATFPDGDYLFTTDRGNAYRRTYITREIDRAARRVLGRSVTAHVLRHSRATDLIERTGKVKGVSRMLGHASEATTLRYYVKQSLTEEELSEGV
ncbi:MAG: tyrosine-type recombinase/integrase [Spirochaetia bacterium]|jgi:integrase